MEVIRWLPATRGTTHHTQTLTRRHNQEPARIRNNYLLCDASVPCFGNLWSSCLPSALCLVDQAEGGQGVDDLGDGLDRLALEAGGLDLPRHRWPATRPFVRWSCSSAPSLSNGSTGGLTDHERGWPSPRHQGGAQVVPSSRRIRSSSGGCVSNRRAPPARKRKAWFISAAASDSTRDEAPPLSFSKALFRPSG